MPPATVFFYRNEVCCVVGGGNTAVEEALYLSNIASKVYLVHRRDKFKAEPILVDKLMDKVAAGKIELKTFQDSGRSIGRRVTGVTGIRLKSVHDGSTEDVTLKGLLHCHRPCTEHRDFPRASWTLENGYIVTQGGLKGFAHSNQHSGRLCCRRCAGSHVYRQAITSAGTGCMAALDAQRYLRAAGIGKLGLRSCRTRYNLRLC